MLCRPTTCVCRILASRRASCRLMSSTPFSDPNLNLFSNLDSSPPSIPFHGGIGPRRPRRHTMTAAEMNTFNEIFNFIFDSLGDKASPLSTSSSSVDIGRSGMADLFSTLRKHSKRMKRVAVSDEALDAKKDEIDRCATDQELLSWALRDVFGESQEYERVFMKAKDESEDGAELPMLQPPTYPFTVELLMRTFRDKYHDPHLALSIFDYARHLSIASYVFGCSTGAYNELITTRWDCFRDLKGVHGALEEMSVNGVDVNDRTRQIADKVRRDVGERSLWVEENEVGLKGVWEMLNNIDRLAHRPNPRSAKRALREKGAPWNRWKSPGLNDDNYEFDRW
ncbi:hypothetical protein MKEN_00669800 [Mycena kentingensis (nom. inval.)]|nr:hypothetical protein MKEN_00669800 [Mycena kentingensis (nom. inval.)]